MNNPLLTHIQTLLENAENGVDEYTILKQVEHHAIFADLSDEGSNNNSGHLPLFKKHFMIMNALYQLQEHYWHQDLLLEITPLNNVLRPGLSHPKAVCLFEEVKGAREYYLNWDHFFDTTEEDVANLYKAFWEYFDKHTNKDEDLATLGLESSATDRDIIARFRELAAIHHPDRGGDAQKFMAVRAAYERLK